MSYTTKKGPQGVSKDIKGALMEGMIGEIVSINDYSHFIEVTYSKDLRELFHKIMLEEKKHFGIFLNILRNFDSEQNEVYRDSQNYVQIGDKNKIKCEDRNSYRNCISKCEILDFIREAIKGELEAILLYNDFLDKVDDKVSKEHILKIIKDEKGHIELLTVALTTMDYDKYF